MTLDDISNLAEKAGCDVRMLDGRKDQSMWCDSEQLIRFVSLIRNEAFEDAAKWLDGMDDTSGLGDAIREMAARSEE